MILIRPAKLEDVPEIVRMSAVFWDESPFKVEFDQYTTEAMAESCISEGTLIVLDVGGSVVGFACLVVGALLGNMNYKSATEIAWWVDSDHRGGKGGIMLMKGLEEIARDKGCKYLSMAFMVSSMPDAVEGIYKKMGYSKTEVLYTKELM